MKLFIPVVGILFSIAACCCGDMGEFAEKMEEIKVEAPQDEGSTDKAEEKTEAKASAGEAVEGACGRYKDWGMTAPSGFKVVACALRSSVSCAHSASYCGMMTAQS